MINIRKMNSADLDSVFTMMRIFYDSPAVEHTSSDQILWKDLEDAVSDLPFIEGYVFEEADKLIGYAMTSLNYTTEYGGICIWLEDLYLIPEARYKGFTTKFFTFLEQQYPYAVRFKLEVEPENESAVAAYKRNGYSISPYHLMTKEMILDN